VGERRSVRTVAQQQPNDRSRSCVKTKSSQEEERQKPKPSSGDCVNRLAQVPLSRAEPQGAKQMAAPAEPRTPNMHRAKRIAPRECGWKHGDSGHSAGEENVPNKNRQEST
jgi:hypothetical protein